VPLLIVVNTEPCGSEGPYNADLAAATARSDKVVSF